MTLSLRAQPMRAGAFLTALLLSLSAIVSSCTSTDRATSAAPATATAAAAAVPPAGRQVLNFDPDWRFIREDVPAAQSTAFDDSRWQVVSAPHTYNDVDTFDNWSTPGHRGEQIQWGGRTWYRKTFNAPAAWQGKKVFIEFEAARQVAEVYLNGELLGVAKTGFTPFGFDLTPHLRLGASNVLAVMVDNRFMKDPLDPATEAELARRNGTQAAAAPLSSTANPNLAQLHGEINKTIPDRLEDLQADQIPWNNPHWHPAHGGLYRNVRLHVTDALHINLPLYSFLETTGPYAYAENITDASARVTVEVPLRNERADGAKVELRVEVIDADGRTALTLSDTKDVAAGASAEFKVTGALSKPRLWEPEYPHVYRVVSALRVGGQTVDTSEIPLGIRTVAWDVANGFFINGRHLKLHGWGQKPTNEWPGLGAALPDWMQFYTLKLMHDAGGNFIRWGHTAAGPAQIAAGDRLGLVADQPGVDGESDTVKAAWQLRAMAFRDVVIYFRNNPSILVWEGGNQKVTREHAAELRGLMDKYDPHGGRGYAHRRADAITAEFMTVGVGTEGGREIATLPVFEGEYNREESPRRVWDNASPPNFGYPEAKGMTYQLTSEQFAANQVAQFKKLSPPWHSGGGNWIFSDSTSGGRVPAEVARAGGEVDGVRLPKEAYYVESVLFRPDPQVHIIGHWSYPSGTKKDVFVASNADAVELFVNGKSLGRGTVSDKYLFTFKDVAWAPGEIKAVATSGGKIVATQTKHSVGAPVRLKITPLTEAGGLRADGSDIALFDVEAVDGNGERCPTVQQRVDFETEGPATWRGGYNSGKINSVNNAYLDLEAGINRVAVRATRQPGKITVRARSEGLEPASATIESHAFAATDGIATLPPVLPTFKLPPNPPAHPTLTATSSVAAAAPAAPGERMLGTYIKRFNYTGPQAAIVHVEIKAANGRNIYVDRDYTFTDLPADLVGADWIQTADDDQRYSAVDLYEISVKGGTTMTIAHDVRVSPPPEWLTRQFQPTGGTLTVNQRPMKLYSRRFATDGSITLGSNNDNAPTRANQYFVLVNATK
jgi:beta-galactosidase